MRYLQVLKYLESFINYEKIPLWPYKESLKLERMRGFLSEIGNPQEFLKCVHIAGSKGKGSTCAFIAYILKEAGYKVGLYTSPHLSDFRERIRILKAAPNKNKDFSGMIPKNDLVRLICRFKPKIDEYNNCARNGALSFFEVYTALAFVYFKEKKIDYAVLETGLGGRLDATNTVNAIICALTPISLEHTRQLGNTIKKIAFEKAGIIKRQDQTVVCAEQTSAALTLIQKRCREVGAKLFVVGKDIRYSGTNDNFKIKYLNSEFTNLKIKLIGTHQLINAAVALGVVQSLGVKDIVSIRRGLYNTIWPGRCEQLARNPLIVLDGAHNVASCRVLKKTIKDYFKYRKLILILGISNDKDISGICREFQGLADKVILTQSHNPRAAELSILERYFNNKMVFKTENVCQAKRMAFRLADKKDLILVTGSLFVVGEFREC
jgi:dihydrofolate synthase / folylpolyglutamate synthase